MRTILCLLLISSVTLLSCKKEVPVEDPFKAFWDTFQGDVTALINGFPATRNGHSLHVRGSLYKAPGWDSSRAAISLILVTNQREKRQTMGMGWFPARPGTYPILYTSDFARSNKSDTTCTSFLSLSGADGDAWLENYYILSSEINYIKITYIDKTEIRGEFNVGFRKNSGTSSSNIPETIVYTNGKFNAKITMNVVE